MSIKALKNLALLATFVIGSVLAWDTSTNAQISGFGSSATPVVFSPNTQIKSSEVNGNFGKLAADSLNRTGGTMTGHLIFSADNTKDIGASGATRPRRGYFGTEVVSPLFTGNLVGNVTGNITSGGVSTFADGSAGSPSISFTSDTNTGFYRQAADTFAAVVNGAMKGSWSPTLSALYNSVYGAVWARDNGTSGVDLNVRAAAGKDGCLSFTEDTIADRWAFKSNTSTDTLTINSGSCGSPTSVGELDASQKRLKMDGSVVAAGVENITANDAETTIADTSTMLRVTATSGSGTLIGFTGGVQGRVLYVCGVATGFTILEESTNAAATSRVVTLSGATMIVIDNQCVMLIYDGTTQRWRPIGGSMP